MTNSNIFPIVRQYAFNVYRVTPKTQQQRQQLSLFYVHRHHRGKKGGRGRERRLSGWHHHSLYSIPVNNTTRKTRRRRDATKIYLSYTNPNPTWISFIPAAVHKAKFKTFSHSLRVCVYVRKGKGSQIELKIWKGGRSETRFLQFGKHAWRDTREEQKEDERKRDEKKPCLLVPFLPLFLLFAAVSCML